MPKHGTFGLRQHRLYGRAPLHGLNSTVQLYAHKECMPPCTNGNGTRRKLHPLFNLQILPEPVSVKDTHPRKEESMKNVYVKWLQPLTNLPYEYILPQNLQKVVVHVLTN